MADEPNATGTPVGDGGNQQANAAVEGAKGDVGGQAPTETPPEKSYSEKEWGNLKAQHDEATKQMRAGHEGTVKEMRGQLAELKRQMREGENTKFLQGVRDSGGDVDVAQKIISMRDTLERREEEVAKREEETTRVKGESEKALRVLAANRLVEEYGLDTSVKAELLKAETPQGMENMALKMAFEKQKAERITPVVPDSGKGSGSGLDMNKLTPSEQLAEAIRQQEARKHVRK